MTPPSRARARLLLSKLGLDGHNRGIRSISRALRDSGFEVIYLGVRRRPEEVAAAAIDEDVDAIGISLLSGAHMTLCADLMRCLDQRGAEIPVVVGGIIPKADRPRLEKLGIRRVFGPGDPLEAAVAVFREILETDQARS